MSGNAPCCSQEPILLPGSPDLPPLKPADRPVSYGPCSPTEPPYLRPSMANAQSVWCAWSSRPRSLDEQGWLSPAYALTLLCRVASIVVLVPGSQSAAMSAVVRLAAIIGLGVRLGSPLVGMIPIFVLFPLGAVSRPERLRRLESVCERILPSGWLSRGRQLTAMPVHSETGCALLRMPRAASLEAALTHRQLIQPPCKHWATVIGEPLSRLRFLSTDSQPIKRRPICSLDALIYLFNEEGVLRSNHALFR